MSVARALRIVAGVMLLVAPLAWPYGYYRMLRLIVVAACGTTAFAAWESGRTFWVTSMLLLGLLFNPIFPVYLSRDIWLPIDLLAGGVFIASYWLLPDERESDA